MRRFGSSNFAPVVGNPNSVTVDPTIPDLWEAPTLDDLMAPDAPTLPSWVTPNPVVPPANGDRPFGPVPVIPDLNKPPIEVDPPSRPPERMFGPPQIVNGAMPLNAKFDANSASLSPQPTRFSLEPSRSPDRAGVIDPWTSYSSRPIAPPMQYKPGGILGMLIDADLIDPANRDRPAPGGLPGLIQEYLRNNPSAGR